MIINGDKKYGILLLMLGMVLGMMAQGDEREFYVFDASNGMAANSAQTIKCTKTGRMVITTIGHVNFYDGNSFAHISPEQRDSYALSKYSGNYRQMFDRHHHFWLKDKYQVICVDLLTETMHHNVKEVFHEMGIDQKVDDLFADSENMMWMLTGGDLVSTDRQQRLKLRKGVPLHDVDVVDGRQVLLFYGDGMMVAHDLKSGRKIYEVAVDTALANGHQNSSVVMPYGEGYYQIRNGKKGGLLSYLDLEKRQWTKVMEQEYPLNNMTVYKDTLYVASMFGYWTIDLKTGRQQHVEELKLSKGRRLKTDVNVIAFDRQGGMWIGTERRGLLYAKPFRSPFRQYSWSDPLSSHYYDLMAAKLDLTLKPYIRHVNSIYKDSRGWTWTGLYSGLKLQKTEGGEERVFSRRDGLMNEMVHSIVEDDNHDLWVSTSFGIAHLYIRGDSVARIETYTHQDNVPNESFVNGMAAKLDDGRIVMQSLDHMVVFDPAALHPMDTPEYVLYPKLVGLEVNGQQIEPRKEYRGQQILARAVTRSQEINVNYDQTTLLLTFSALNYFRPMQTYYRLRVKGSRRYNDWCVLSHGKNPNLVNKYGLLKLQLMNLVPGDYEVELQASLTPDNWSQEPYVWTIKVHQPWWRTTGLYLLLAVLGLLLAALNVVYYNRNTKLRLIRNGQESDLLRRIKTFANRCETMSQEVLTPYTMTQNKSGITSEYGLVSDEFAEVMLKIIPYVNGLKDEQDFNVTELSKLTGKPTIELYTLMADQLDKNPRILIGRLRLQEVERLLRETTLNVEEIADKCHYVSPNYLIAAFYHRYRMTPNDYRNSSAR